MAVFVQPKILDVNGFVQVLHSDEYRITLKVSNTIVSGIYFPPKLHKKERLKYLENDKMVRISDVILGDFNIHKKDSIWKTFLRTMKTKNLERDQNESKTHYLGNAIDHIFYNPNFMRKIHTKYQWGECSDHKIISLEIPALKIECNKRIQTWRLKNHKIRQSITERAKQLHINLTNNIDTLNRRIHTLVKSVYKPI